MSTLDWLRERIERHVLTMAALQLVIMVGVLIYGWIALGSRFAYPSLIIFAVFALLVVVTLVKPWNPDVDFRPESWRLLCDRVILIAVPVCMASLFIRLIRRAVRVSHELQSADILDSMLKRERIAAWAEDTYGTMIASDLGTFTWIAVAALLVGTWFFVPLEGSKPGYM